jgi:hypothetical protein
MGKGVASWHPSRMKSETYERRSSAGLSVDYPQEGELISARGYTFRIAGQALNVEVAIDGDEWRPCRPAQGYWWFDWSGYASGRHQMLVRGRPEAGAGYTFRTCRFKSEDA